MRRDHSILELGFTPETTRCKFIYKEHLPYTFPSFNHFWLSVKREKSYRPQVQYAYIDTVEKYSKFKMIRLLGEHRKSIDRFLTQRVYDSSLNYRLVDLKNQSLH